MIQYFRKDLKPLIQAKIEQRGWELDSFEELVEKAKDMDTKAALQPCAYARDTNQYCLRKSQPKPKKAKFGPWKDLRNKKPKFQTQEVVPMASQP